MNEQIKKLLDQATMDALHETQNAVDLLDNPVTKQQRQLQLEKFAELIVKECISINRQRMFSDYEGDSHRVAHNNALLCANSDMFEHFGVEE